MSHEVNASRTYAQTVRTWLNNNPDAQAEAALKKVNSALADVENLLPATLADLSCNGTVEYNTVYHEALQTACHDATFVFFIGLFLKAGLFVAIHFAAGIVFCICRQPKADAMWDDEDDERRPLLAVSFDTRGECSLEGRSYD